MTDQFTKSQVDRLGDRLRSGKYKETDLVFLDDYRKSFHQIYKTTVETMRDRTKIEPTGRPAKSTSAIIEKLKRESIRLSQIQDIAGCRIVVDTIIDQNQIVSSLSKLFPSSDIVDRRLQPSHGYRAVHLVVNVDGQSIEIQVRSRLQHLWAEISEKLSDVMDPNIKYGGGKEYIQLERQESMLHITNIEKTELDIADLEKREIDIKLKVRLGNCRNSIMQVKRELADNFEKYNMFLGKNSK